MGGKGLVKEKGGTVIAFGYKRHKLDLMDARAQQLGQERTVMDWATAKGKQRERAQDSAGLCGSRMGKGRLQLMCCALKKR